MPSKRDQGSFSSRLKHIFKLRRQLLRGWRLMDLDMEQGVCIIVGKEKQLLTIEVEARDDKVACYDRTDHFNIHVRRQFDDGKPLSVDEHFIAVYTAKLIGMTLDVIPETDRPGQSRKVMVREIQVDRILIEEGRGHYYLNPYVGCTIG